jgi:hypothetical protein
LSSTPLSSWLDDPRELIEELVAYRGTTDAAIEAMAGLGFAGIVGQGLSTALQNRSPWRDLFSKSANFRPAKLAKQAS